MKNITKLLIIDPFVKQPVNNCFNRLCDLFNAKLYLYQPAFFPFDLYTIPQVDAYIVLGSASHVHEKLNWHQSLSHFLHLELQNNKPVLGLCFGHQLIANYYGCSVDFLHQNQDKIIGSRLIEWGENTYELGVTHRQSVLTLSNEIISLSSKTEFGHDIIKHKTFPFLGCQAHPEASNQFLQSDCQIVDYKKREKIIDESSKFLLTWFREYL